MKINIGDNKHQSISVGDLLMIKDIKYDDYFYRYVIIDPCGPTYHTIDFMTGKVTGDFNNLDKLFSTYSNGPYTIVEIIKADDLELSRI